MPYSWHSTTPTPTPTRTSSRGSSPTRLTRAISYGKLYDTPTFSRSDLREDVGQDVGVGIVECQLTGSHSVTCRPAGVTFPPLSQPTKTATRFSDPERMKVCLRRPSLVDKLITNKRTVSHSAYASSNAAAAAAAHRGRASNSRPRSGGICNARLIYSWREYSYRQKTDNTACARRGAARCGAVRRGRLGSSENEGRWGGRPAIRREFTADAN